VLRIGRSVVVLVCAAFVSLQSGAQTASRAADLASSLTLEESIDLLGGIGFATRPIPRLGIPSFRMSDGPVGARTPPPSTAYAAGIGLAASWDVALAREIGTQLGRDARSRGAAFLLGPGVNLYRAPMNGRNFEYFGEDPWLAGQIAVGYIEGVQSQGVAATIKHYLGNNSEFARETSDSVIDERTLREIYLPAFEAAVKRARVGSVMSSYNLANGTYTTASSYLVRKVLKGDWGFQGVYMSDWGATHESLAAVNAGLDLEMPTGRFMNRSTLEPAIRDGTLTRAVIDDKVRRLLGLADRFGWMTRTEPDASIPRYNQQGKAAARLGALEGAVLLQNKGDLLPLDRTRTRTVAVIGPTAHPAIAGAGGSGYVPTFSAVSVLEGISDKLGADATVTYARGIPLLRILGILSQFKTARENGELGVTVETFADASFSGSPRASRTERHFARGMAGFGGDPEYFTLLDSLPPGESRAVMGSLSNPKPDPAVERWTGWYTPRSAGSHTIFVQNTAPYRLFIDDQLVLDSSKIRAAALRQMQRTLDAGPHKVVFEQAAPQSFGRPFWRVGIVREGTFVEPLAKELASRADAVVLAVGFDAETETESADREFALPPGQDELIREITAVNPNTVVVVIAGGSVAAAQWADRARAIVAAWYPGQEGGAALADLLFGDANFSGRLPISWERHAEDNPTFASYYYNDPQHPNRIVYREGVFVGYRGFQRTSVKPQFPFGFGLSYTSFRYDNVRVAAASQKSALYEVSFDITNTGARAGADVAQVYISPKNPKIARPRRELKGFERVALAPGETRRVTIPLGARAFTYFDVKAGRWRADPGTYTVEVARSSEDIQATSEIRLTRPLRVSVSD
jgi:beta-glucosidase